MHNDFYDYNIFPEIILNISERSFISGGKDPNTSVGSLWFFFCLEKLRSLHNLI